MILSWQLDGAGWLISIISPMILILAARWLSLHAVFLPEFCPHSALIWQLTLAPKTSTKDIAIRNSWRRPDEGITQPLRDKYALNMLYICSECYWNWKMIEHLDGAELAP